MKIGIDARMLGPHVGGGGLGRYVEEFVSELQQQDQKNRYILFMKKKGGRSDTRTKFQHSHSNFTTVFANVHWYTLKEQLLMPRIIDREQLDLVHFPHWNVPYFLKTPFVVTIHDLILLEEPRSARVTTRHPIVYTLKYLAYRLILKRALKRAKAIIAVSQYTKSAILTHFPWVSEEKIHVIHEGLTQFPTVTSANPLNISKPYFLYVGNAYPHKNLETLLHAFSFFHKLYPDVQLVLAGRDDVFYQRLRKELEDIEIPPDVVRFISHPSDEDLVQLYTNAHLYVFPSRSEGFGLPPLEAMNFGVPVVAAKRTSLPEVLGDAALWFDPDDIEQLVRVMENVMTNHALRADLSKKGRIQASRYSWKRMTQETLKIFETCL